MANHTYLTGCYTDPDFLPGARGRGVTALVLDTDTGRLTVGKSFPGPANPSYLVVAPGGRRAFAVHETALSEAAPQGWVSSWRLEGDEGTWEGSQPSGGGWPCHLALNPAGDRLAVANYFDGTVEERIVEARGLGAVTRTFRAQGRGPTGRQEGPHAHQVVYGQDGRLWSVDLGTDQIRADGQAVVTLAPGSGPRHFVADPQGRWLAVVNELAGTLETWKPGAGVWVLVDRSSTLPSGEDRGPASSAALRLSPDGRFLVASNRGEWNNLVWWAVDPETGRLGAPAWIPSGGRSPRDLVIDPSGRWVLAANQESGTVTVFTRNPETGTLAGPVHSVEVPTVVCLALVPRT